MTTPSNPRLVGVTEIYGDCTDFSVVVRKNIYNVFIESDKKNIYTFFDKINS